MSLLFTLEAKIIPTDLYYDQPLVHYYCNGQYLYFAVEPDHSYINHELKHLENMYVRLANWLGITKGTFRVVSPLSSWRGEFEIAKPAAVCETGDYFSGGTPQ